ncbi:MAG TPA: RHS repeat-associated core domain-containing protein, partial [Chthonomonadales bacterium]|nr:RHS repeat-associated core domain-containing protein [Chthonomonadales bacterium]
TSEKIAGVSTAFSLDSDDELTSTSGGITDSFSYNANGEQTGRTIGGVAHTLSFDYDGELTSIAWGSSTTSFTYDALGRRASRTASGTTTNFQYADRNVLLEKQGSSTTRAYTLGGGLLRQNGEYPLFDGQGSERTVTDNTQAVTGTINYDAFGGKAGYTGSSTDPYTYNGQWGYRNDDDDLLAMVGARYYDVTCGRFISRDTNLSQLPYAYCAGDPVNYVDPGGHVRVPKWLRGLLVAAGLSPITGPSSPPVPVQPPGEVVVEARPGYLEGPGGSGQGTGGDGGDGDDHGETTAAIITGGLVVIGAGIGLIVAPEVTAPALLAAAAA